MLKAAYHFFVTAPWAVHTWAFHHPIVAGAVSVLMVGGGILIIRLYNRLEK